MKTFHNNQEKMCAVLAWLTIIGACSLGLVTLYGLLWLGYILGFKM